MSVLFTKTQLSTDKTTVFLGPTSNIFMVPSTPNTIQCYNDVVGSLLLRELFSPRIAHGVKVTHILSDGLTEQLT